MSANGFHGTPSAKALRPQSNSSNRSRALGQIGLRPMRKRVSALVIVMLLSSSCSTMVGPDYVKPSAPTEEQWLESEDRRVKTAPEEYSDWWTVFNDPVLNTLIATAYRQNLPLQIAGIRILEARAVLGITVGNQYPQLQQGRGGTTRNRISEHAANTAGADKGFWDYEVGFDAAWELDVWGRFRRAVESGLANFEASIASYDDALVSLTAEVARTYVLLCTFEERLAIARENVRIQERSLQIAQARFRGGAVTELDVQQATSLLKDTEASLPRFEAGIRQAQNALAILLGVLPGKIDEMLGGAGVLPQVPQEIVVDIPAELMRRRPDIRLAEYQVATQSPLIGVSKADLYPAFSLLGSIGLRSSNSPKSDAGHSDFGDLFDADSIEWFAGPSFTWNLFNYGRIKNRVRAEDARFQQLVVNYEDTVLRAHQEVEDALVGFLRKDEEEGFLHDSVKASQRSVDLSLIQYREGLVDYQRVLDTQRFLAQEQDLWTATRGDVVLNLIAVYKALGGGWQIREGEDFVPAEIMEEMRRRTDWGNILTPEKQGSPASDAERLKWRWPDW
ncbi:MAG: efflux transporter outer membrane subunit [Desulfobacterales bacterium]|nr:MAG: efflux transporter outer membrane subunit [Desulfobacterales bacterium]